VDEATLATYDRDAAAGSAAVLLDEPYGSVSSGKLVRRLVAQIAAGTD